MSTPRFARALGSRALAMSPAQMFLVAAQLSLPFASLGASGAQAQSWASDREQPALFEIVAIDATGESDFPYGREDVAGDGLGSFAAAEAGADLRTLYASAEPMELWLRAYLAGSAAPRASLRAFFFIDSDARASSGGAAQGTLLDERLADDPTPGGYERAIALAGDGMVQGVFEWNATTRSWLEVTATRAEGARGEAGLAADPLAIGSQQHGYLQLVLTHSLSGLSQSCGGTLFVRVLDDGPAMRTLADDAPERIACQARKDEHEVPQVLRPEGCDADAQCPADGVCRAGACLFTFSCTDAEACPSGYACSQDRCVRIVTGSCRDAADCDGLVCDDGSCAACSERGARACASGLTCAPDGSCVDPGELGGSGGAASPPGKVRGGAFSCALGAPAAHGALALLALLSAAFVSRRRRARGAARRGRGEA